MPIPRLISGSAARIALGALVALSLIAGASAANADGKSAATAMPLTSIATGSITGSTTGAFSYYTFNYPGDGSVGTLTISISPSDPVTEVVVGANLYQNGSLLANMNSVGNPPGMNSVTFSSTTAAPVLVQVYNYSSGTPVSFQLQLNGVNQATPAPAATATPLIPALATPTLVSSAPQGDGSPSNPFALNGTATGQLPGNAAGSYVYYTYPVAGDGSTQTLHLTFSPGGGDVGTNVFVTVFQNGTQLVSLKGTTNDNNPPGVLPVSFVSSVAGPVLVQVGNFDATQTIDYTLSR
jgi:hypothetical protein